MSRDDWIGLAGQIGSGRPSGRDRWLAGVVAALCLGAAFWAVHAPGSSTPPKTASVVREVVGAQPVSDATGLPWKAGHHFVGGRLQLVGTVAGSASSSLYTWALEGVRSYSVPLPNGVYDVVLRFADGTCHASGCRRFGVRLEGATVASSLDIASLVGPLHAFSVVQRTPVTDGHLDATFVPQIGLPTISAVEVSRAPAGSSLARVWGQEFNGPAHTAPDASHWLHDVGAQGWGNHELQAYTDSVDNAAMDGRGNLTITARKDARPGAGDVITSARLETKQRFSFLYGVLKARIAVPLGRGLWPALWMVGDNGERIGWAAAGEVDIFEGNGGRPGWSWFTLHGPDSSGQVYGFGAAHAGSAATAAAYHEYVLTWTPDALGLAIDGEPVVGVTRADLPTAQKWVFDHPYRLVLNLAVGGAFVDPPDGTTRFPAVMRVDYIRVYQ